MKEVFERIMDEYLTEKGEGEFADNALGNFVRREAPSIISEDASLTKAFQVTGAVGQGNWAEIPWICVFDKQITTSAQHGYYIGYLFKSDMSGVYLSLNMGWTQFKAKYKTTRVARQRIEATANKCEEILQSGVGDFSTEPINLLTNGVLGIGYERGHICGKYYPDYMLPEDVDLVNDLRNLIGVYRELKGILKAKDIVTLIDTYGEVVAEEDEAEDNRYNRNVEKAEPTHIPPTPQEKPPHTLHRGYKRWNTKPGIGKTCIINANFNCEVNPAHKTFTSKVTSRNFVEVHHLIPMSFQDDFKHSLDVPANIIAVCPNCHRQLHHAEKDEIEDVIQGLLESREVGMQQASISTSARILFKYYQLY